MKTYFIVSDVHGFYTELRKALKEKGFNERNKEHILILCGDAFDRGAEAVKLLNFLTKLNKQERLIYINGNHEWLMEDLFTELKWDSNISSHHWSNGTVGTLAQLCGVTDYDIIASFLSFDEIWAKLEKYNTLVGSAKNYYETKNYIFVHGWLPRIRDYSKLHEITEEAWKEASWYNGMEEWNNGWKPKDKTVVCGHFHTSWGNYNLHHIGFGEFTEDALFEPFIDKNIICLDACTAWTHKINVLVIDEKDL